MVSRSSSKQKRSGFTLLELLVVISIIGILVAMGAIAYSTAQKKGRDARRQADMKAYQNAQEQYYAQNTAYATTQGQLGDYLSAGLKDPKGVNYSISVSSTGDKYCACAGLEGGSGGNASGLASGGSCNWTEGNHFCVKNLQ